MAELNSRFSKNKNLQENLCALCKLIINEEEEREKNYFEWSECNHKFHKECVVGLFSFQITNKCPAANCEQSITKEEMDKISQGILESNKAKKQKIVEKGHYEKSTMSTGTFPTTCCGVIFSKSDYKEQILRELPISQMYIPNEGNYIYINMRDY